MKNLGFLGHEHYAVDECGNVMTLRKGRLMKPSRSKLGYMVLTLGGSKRKMYKVHRLVMLAYKYEEGCEDLQVNHIDGNKENNHISNLEWCNSKHNNLHAVRTGLRPLQSVTEEQVHEICQLFEADWRNCDIARAMNIDQSLVANIRKGDLCAYISEKYTFTKRKYDQRSPKTVRKICEMLQAQELNSVEIAKITNVTPDYVRNIKARNIQTAISENYIW